MANLGGRPRKVDALRHPDGSVVRTVYQEGRRFALSLWQELKDSERAKQDPRENTVAGQLEIAGTRNGGITKFERLAGERWCEFMATWRRKIALSPSPNAPACNVHGANGKAIERDPFDQTPEEAAKIEFLRLRHERIEKIFKACKAGEKVRSALESIFVLNNRASRLTVVRARRALKLLIFEFGLTGETDFRYRNVG